MPLQQFLPQGLIFLHLGPGRILKCVGEALEKAGHLNQRDGGVVRVNNCQVRTVVAGCARDGPLFHYRPQVFGESPYNPLQDGVVSSPRHPQVLVAVVEDVSQRLGDSPTDSARCGGDCAAATGLDCADGKQVESSPVDESILGEGEEGPVYVKNDESGWRDRESNALPWSGNCLMSTRWHAWMCSFSAWKSCFLLSHVTLCFGVCRVAESLVSSMEAPV